MGEWRGKQKKEYSGTAFAAEHYPHFRAHSFHLKCILTENNRFSCTGKLLIYDPNSESIDLLNPNVYGEDVYLFYYCFNTYYHNNCMHSALYWLHWYEGISSWTKNFMTTQKSSYMIYCTLLLYISLR